MTKTVTTILIIMMIMIILITIMIMVDQFLSILKDIHAERNVVFYG